jgi:hypothetical protein
MLTTDHSIRFKHGRGVRNLKPTSLKSEDGPGRIPRVSKLMALAIRMDGLIREGVVTDQAEIARIGQVTTARMSQIMNLLNLAPDIQEAILFLPEVTSGKPTITERHLRLIAAELSWARQRSAWGRVVEPRQSDTN